MTDITSGPGAARGGASPRDAAIEELVVEALAALESRGPAVIEDLVRAHPEQAEALLARLAKLRGIGLLGSPEATAEPIPERLGEFVLRARIGGGGMGVVYLAAQERLARLVALKVVRPDLLFFEGARARFEREAQAVARLAHPSIVPVYSVGEDGGVPWFAMEYVRGATLAEVIAEVRQRDPVTLRAEDLWATVERLEKRRAESLGDPRAQAQERSRTGGAWSRAAAEVVRDVADAVQHAHELGVLHRDVKPSNVLLTAAGRALLFDFGLAASADAARLTTSGVRVGSLAYMAPEQLDGHADERSDVYGLAVTLYELATLDLPFLPSGGEALATAVRQGDVVPPRRRNPAIPIDLETVILAGLEIDPARRYQSAAEFAAELSRVIELRSIRAVRPGVVRRALRFAQRHTAATAVGAIALAALIAGPSAWIVQERRAARAVGEALERADANLERALEAVDRMLVHVGDQRLAEVPASAPVREALLADAVAFFETFLDENAGDPRLLRESVRASTKLAWLFVQLGRTSDVAVAARRAMDHAERWLAQGGGDDALVGWARAVDPWVQAAGIDGDLAVQEELCRALLARLEPAVAADPDHLDLGVAVATALDHRARLAMNLGQLDAAEADYARAVEVLGGLAVTRPDHEALSARVAMAYNNRGNFLLAGGRAADAVAPLREAWRVSLALLATRADAMAAETEIAAVEANLAGALTQGGEHAEALELLGSAYDRLTRALDAFPERAEWRRYATAAGAHYAQALERAGRRAEAIAVHRRCVELERITLAEHPTREDARVALALAVCNLAGLLRAEGGLADAEETAREGLQLMAAFESIRPKDRLLVRTLFQHVEYVRLTAGDHEGVAEAVELHLGALGDDAVDVRIAAGVSIAGLALLEADEAMAPEQRAALVATRLEEALGRLRIAAEAGKLTRADLEGAGNFAYLRSRPDFEVLAALLLGDG